MADFYKSKIPIIDVSHATYHLINPMGAKSGLVPRDLNEYPPTMFADPSTIEVIPKSEWDAYYDEQEEQESSLEHMFLRGDKPAFTNLDQDGDGDCVPADTRVRMADGAQKKIQDVKLLDLVMTAEGNIGRVKQRHVRKFAGELITVKAAGHAHGLRATPEHPVLTRRGYVRLGEVANRDWISIPKHDLPLKNSYRPVQTVTHEPFAGTVFNLGVEGDNSYIAEGVGVHNCWAYSTGHSMMLQYLRDGVPPDEIPRLNPHFIATYLRRFNGGWCGASMEVARDVGCCVEGNGPDEWPKWSHEVSLLNAERLAGAAKHKVTELIYDMRKEEWDQSLGPLEIATMGLTNTPAPSDFNEMSHSVCQVRWVRTEANSWWPLILNSWKGWGYYGLGVLRGMDADGAVATLATTPY